MKIKFSRILKIIFLSEFVKAFETEFDVTAAAPVAVAAAGGAAAGAADAAQDEFTIILEDAGSQKIAVIKEVRAKYADLETDTATGDQASLTGRIIFKRDTGKLCFATLREGDGTELQAMLSLDKVGEEQLDAWKRDVDLGDIVSVTGEIITSKRGELSLLADFLS